MKEYIEEGKACKTSSEMYSICEELATDVCLRHKSVCDMQSGTMTGIKSLVMFRLLHTGSIFTTIFMTWAEDLNE